MQTLWLRIHVNCFFHSWKKNCRYEIKFPLRHTCHDSGLLLQWMLSQEQVQQVISQLVYVISIHENHNKRFVNIRKCRKYSWKNHKTWSNTTLKTRSWIMFFFNSSKYLRKKNPLPFCAFNKEKRGEKQFLWVIFL